MKFLGDFEMEPTPSSVESSSVLSLVDHKLDARDTPKLHNPTNDEATRPGSLLEYSQILLRNKGIILLFGFVAVVLSAALTLSQTPIYRATAALEVLNLNEDFLFSKVSPISDVDRSNETSELQTQVRIIQSSSLLDQVIQELGGKPSSSPTLLTDRLLNHAAASLKVRIVGRTRVIELSVESSRPRTATTFVNTLTSEFSKQNLESRWKAAEDTSNFLRRELDATRLKLERSEDVLQNYARKSGLIFTENNNVNVADDRLRQLQQELTLATADRLAKQSRFELAQKAQLDTLPDVLNDKELRDAHAKITDLQRRIAELSVTYTPEDPRVRRLTAELAELQSSFKVDRGFIASRIQNDFHESERREHLIASAFAEQTKAVVGQGERSIEYNILKHDVDSNRQLYDSMLQQLKQSSIASAMRASNIRVLDPAKVPVKPVSPNLPINIGAGLMLGLITGTAFAFVRERTDRTLRRAGEVQLWTSIPELGVVPNAFYAPRFQTGALGAKHEYDSLTALAAKRPPTLIADAFRTILTSVLFTCESRSEAQVLVFTSAEQSDGKTTIVTNLALAMAEVRKRVLVIDADMRRPRMHTLFEVPNDEGLSTLLDRSRVLGEDVFRSVRTTGIPDLHVLTSGPRTSGAAKLLHSPALGQLLAHLRKKYDMILIDSPPVQYMPDARIVGRHANGVILVARAAHTTRDAIAAMQRRFATDNIVVLGTILNAWNPDKLARKYYEYAASTNEANL